MSVRPIQTRFRGVLYRSRTEARWAAFFESLQLKTQYEAEGFDLPNGESYLPDFFIPSLPLYVEVKGETPTADERRKAYWLYDLTGVPVLIVIGDPSMRRGEIFNSFFDAELGPPKNSFFGGCRRCNQIAVAYEWENGHGYEPFGVCGDPMRCAEREASQETDRIEAAIQMSLSERFGVHPAK